MIDEAVISLIISVGFPIALVCYLMFRFEAKLSENTESVRELLIYLKNKR